jgi:hypothetical protein
VTIARSDLGASHSRAASILEPSSLLGPWDHAGHADHEGLSSARREGPAQDSRLLEVVVDPGHRSLLG